MSFNTLKRLSSLRREPSAPQNEVSIMRSILAGIAAGIMACAPSGVRVQLPGNDADEPRQDASQSLDGGAPTVDGSMQPDNAPVTPCSPPGGPDEDGDGLPEGTIGVDEQCQQVPADPCPGEFSPLRPERVTDDCGQTTVVPGVRCSADGGIEVRYFIGTQDITEQLKAAGMCPDLLISASADLSPTAREDAAAGD